MVRIVYVFTLMSLCTATLCAQCGSTCYPPSSPPYCAENCTYVWNYNTCSWDWEPYSPSPIVIDTDGTGFHMTSVADGIMFDFYGDGNPIQIAWTAKGSSTGWLALPKDGKISSARDLFGSITAQPLTDSHPPMALRLWPSTTDLSTAATTTAQSTRVTRYGLACAFGSTRIMMGFRSPKSCELLIKSESPAFFSSMNPRRTQTAMVTSFAIRAA